MKLNEIQVSYNSGSKGIKITSAIDSYKALKPIFDDGMEFREKSIALYLNKANEVLGYFTLGLGGNSGVVMDVKMAFGIGLKCNASAMIMAHNHPSGNLQPSQADKNITKKFKEVGQLLDLQVLDHLILTSESYYSFANEGLI